MSHQLHMAVAETIERQLKGSAELIRDPACGGKHQLPLFAGSRRGRDTRMCCVDLLIISADRVRVIVEVEESGFLPTKICGKFLQSALATHFIHDSQSETVVPYGDRVPFVQILDGSRCLKKGTKKDLQAKMIEQKIRELLPLKTSHISAYKLFFISGKNDEVGLADAGMAISVALNEWGIGRVISSHKPPGAEGCQ